jgi:hypothetical protein
MAPDQNNMFYNSSREQRKSIERIKKMSEGSDQVHSKEKEYTDFNVMFREMQNHLLENGGSLISSDPSFDSKACWFHPETKTLFSIKTRNLQATCSGIFPHGFKDFATRSVVDEMINDIRKLEEADAIGNVK